MQSPSIRKDRAGEIIVTRNELRQLVYWAVFGIGKAKGGSYWDEVVETCQKYGKKLGLASYKNLEFGELLEYDSSTIPKREGRKS